MWWEDLRGEGWWRWGWVSVEQMERRWGGERSVKESMRQDIMVMCGAIALWMREVRLENIMLTCGFIERTQEGRQIGERSCLHHLLAEPKA